MIVQIMGFILQITVSQTFSATIPVDPTLHETTPFLQTLDDKYMNCHYTISTLDRMHNYTA